MKILSDEESEACDFLVCAPLSYPLILPDNLVGICSQCGGSVQYRPHAPTRPLKMCFNCYEPEQADRITITETTASEVTNHYKKKPN